MKTSGVDQSSTKEILKHKKELNRMKSIHGKEIENLKATQRAEIDEVKFGHQEQVDSEVRHKEKVLSDMRESLAKTKKMTDQELRQIQENAFKVKENERQLLENKLAQTSNDYELVLQDKNAQFNTQMKDLNDIGQIRQNDIKSDKSRELAKTQEQWARRIDETKTKFNQQFEGDQAQYERILKNQSEQQRKVVKSDYIKNQNQLKAMNEKHVIYHDQISNQNNKQLVDQEKFHETKYQGTLKTHQSTLQDLQGRFDEELSKIKNSLSKNVELTSNTSSDPFFEYVDLKPELSQNDKEIEVKINIPDYAKDELRMTTNDRELIFTFDRRFQDNRKDERGESRVSRVETVVSRIKSPVDIDVKKIEKNYDNGVMTFKIAKAV